MLQLLEIRALAAPNIWGDVPVLECRLVCEPVSDEILDAVFQRLQGSPRSTLLMERRHYPSAAHAIVELVLALQRCADCPVVQGEVRPTPFAHVWQLAFEIEQEPIGRAALEAACRLLSTAAKGRPDDVEDHLANVRRVAEKQSFGGTTSVLVAAARQRRIPVYRLDDESLIQLGQGTKQHRLRMAATDRTGFIAEWISRDKLLTKQLLQRAGIPVATGRMASDADDACRAAREIGGAVVVKPCDADFGRGVSVDLIDSSEIRGAYDLARGYSPNVLVESYLAGYWHRLLVVNGEMVAAVRKEPPCVVGDGKRTIAELIDEFNADPRRGFDERHILDPLEVGAAVLGMLYRQGYSLDSVPPAGFTVLLRSDAYLATGATQTDVTDQVHPELAETAVYAAETIGLDVAGIDLICEEISRPPAEQSVGVLEVNAEPAIVVHMAPISNPARPVGEKIVASLFPVGDSGRIPVVAVVNDLRLARSLADPLQVAGKTVGFAAKDEASVNGRRIGRKQMSALAAAETLWMHRRIDFGLIHFTFRDLLQNGLPTDHCDLLCLAGLDEAAPPRSGAGMDEIERVLRLLLQPERPAQEILVNLDHVPLCQRLSWPVPHAILVSEHPDRAELQQHTAAGGRFITLIDGQLVLRTALAAQTLSNEPPDVPLFEAAAKAWIERHFLTNSNGPRRDSNRRVSA